MNTIQINRKKKGISPIIATLLLILIAIAAGVVVYAYVIGFVGNSTTNAGGSTDTLSIDQLYLSHVTTNVPVTAYVRNEGPSAENYNTGFLLEASNLNLILGPAVTVQVTLAGTTPSATIAKVVLVYISATSVQVQVTLNAACTGTAPTIALQVNGFGGTAGNLAATACSSVGPFDATITGTTETISSTFTSTTGLALGLVDNTVGAVNYVFGTTVTAGTLSSSVNTVATLTLAPQSTTSNVNTNQLNAGTTYTIQVTGTDGASTTLSNKAT
jgi:archaeal type IV pilus assembly protein PilA